MKKKRMVLVMAVSAMCMMAGCGNTVKDGTEALEQGDYDTAIASFEEAAGSDDKEEAAEGYCGLGMTYYEQKQYDQALEMLEKAFDNGTVKTAELCNLAGTSALCKEDYAKALEYIQEGIALAEEKPDIMYLSTAVKISPFFILYRMRFFPVAVPVPFFPEMSVIRPR